jgi:heat shock protein HslJ
MDPANKTEKLPLLPVLAGLMILIPLLVAAGCTGQSPVSLLLLNGTSWTLTGYVLNGTSLQVINGTTVTMDFSDETRITGSAGCNHYFASYGIQGTAITFGEAGSTLMYCTGTGVMEQESAYLMLLRRAASLTAGNDSLTLADTEGRTILTFTRTIPPEPEPLAGTNWTLESIRAAGGVSSVIAGTTITAVFEDDGRVAGSGGCNRYFASYNTSGTSISIWGIGSTKMHCTGPGIMQQESTCLESLGKAAAFTITGNRLILADANGTTLLSFVKES